MFPKLKRVCNRCGGTGKMANGATKCTACGKEFVDVKVSNKVDVLVGHAENLYATEIDNECLAENVCLPARNLFKEIVYGIDGKMEGSHLIHCPDRALRVRIANRFSYLAGTKGLGNFKLFPVSYILALKDRTECLNVDVKQLFMADTLIIDLTKAVGVVDSIMCINYLIGARNAMGKFTLFLASDDFMLEVNRLSYKQDPTPTPQHFLTTTLVPNDEWYAGFVNLDVIRYWGSNGNECTKKFESSTFYAEKKSNKWSK